MQHYTPAAPAVRETLERILASETFARSERARNLLRYLVEREQQGEANRLKGFAIAMDVFGKDADFDPATDAVVRVQAGRLRDLLSQYATTEGADDPLRIVIPRGSYVPIYEYKRGGATNGLLADMGSAPADADLPESPVPLPSIRRQFRLVWLALGLVVLMLGLLTLRQNGMVPPLAEQIANVETTVATASISPPAPNETLPLVYMSVNDTAPAAARVAAAMRAGLPGFDWVDFIGRNAETFSGSHGLTSFVFEVGPGATAGDVAVELQHLASGRVLVSRNLTPADTEQGVVEDRVAGLLSATVLPSGSIYRYIEQARLDAGLTRCLLLGEAYFLDQNARNHETAYRCLEDLADQDAKSALVYSGLAALQMESITDNYAYPPHASFETAKGFAHKAVLMGATSPSAHRTYGFLNARLGSGDDSLRWMRKAYELNTYDLSMAAAYGYGLIFSGRYREGTPIILRAVEASSAHPTWWDFGLFLGAFMQGDQERAARAASALTTTDVKSHYLAAQLIAATGAGNDQMRRRILNELVTRFPAFAADPRHAFSERRYPPDLTNRLVSALREAGLGKGS